MPQLSIRLLVIALLPLCGSCERDTSYFPLANGHWWYYAIQRTILDEPRTARAAMRNIGQGRLDGEPVFIKRTQSGSLDYLQRSERGVERVAFRRPGSAGLQREQSPRLIVPDTNRGNASWSVDSELFLIESRTFAPADKIVGRGITVSIMRQIAARDAAVETPAGRFTDCLLITGTGRTVVQTDRGSSRAGVDVSTREWYAPGVGLVRAQRLESSTSKFLKPGTMHWTLLDSGN